MTTRAFSQNASSVGLASGSLSTPACTCSSVMRRNRRQSVFGRVFEILPEVSSLMRFGPPRRNDLALVVIPVRVEDGDFDAVHETDRVDAYFAILEPVIGSLDCRTIENS